jgi:hypothetical protein
MRIHSFFASKSDHAWPLTVTRGTMGSGTDNQQLEFYGLALPVRLAGLFQDPGDLSRNHAVRSVVLAGSSWARASSFARDASPFRCAPRSLLVLPKNLLRHHFPPDCMLPAKAVRLVQGARNGSDIHLRWDPVSTTVARYFVLRATSSCLGPYALISGTNGLMSPAFVDIGAPAGLVRYQVRSSELVHSGSGTFWNPIQSVTITVP